MGTSKSIRRGIVAAIGILLAIGIAAGAQAQGTPPLQSTGTEASSVLLLGIVRLRGTPAAISPQQAAQLLPIVQAWRQQLREPPVPAQQPLQAPAGGSATAVDAIQAILTPQQRTAIAGMNLTSADVTSWLASPIGIPPGGFAPGTGGAPQGQPNSTPPTGPQGAPPGSPPPSGSVPQENPTLRFADAVIALLTSWATGP